MPDLNKPAEDRQDRLEQVALPSDQGEFYRNTRTGEIEEGKVSPARERIGPYPTRAAAAQAYERAADRNEAWDEADKAWEDDR